VAGGHGFERVVNLVAVAGADVGGVHYLAEAIPTCCDAGEVGLADGEEVGAELRMLLATWCVVRRAGLYLRRRSAI
jgi:hypothetical protein